MRTGPEAVDAEFRAVGLDPLEPYTRATEERECRCATCGTRRRVKLARLRRRDGIACRWCHGWAKWGEWSEQARARAFRFGWSLGDVDESTRRIQLEGLAPLTTVGDLYQPVGVVCLTCGETLVTVPERISAERPGWFGCDRCAQDRKRRVRDDAPKVFAEHGLRLLEPCRGEYAPQPVECMTCGTVRRVSYNDLGRGTAALCWTCTHGIRPDEPHRVYLVHFALLGVYKVGITHNRHDRRLLEHAIEGGRLIESLVLSDREAARRLEQIIKARYAPWAVVGMGPQEFPQGGWTEAWHESAPLLNLEAAAAAAT